MRHFPSFNYPHEIWEVLLFYRNHPLFYGQFSSCSYPHKIWKVLLCYRDHPLFHGQFLPLRCQVSQNLSEILVLISNIFILKRSGSSYSLFLVHNIYLQSLDLIANLHSCQFIINQNYLLFTYKLVSVQVISMDILLNYYKRHRSMLRELYLDIYGNERWYKKREGV